MIKKHNFSVEDVLAVFSSKLFDEAACRTAVLDILHPGQTRCPKCTLPFDDTKTLTAFMNGRLSRCSCGHRFTARTGTLLRGSHLSYAQVFLLAVLIDFKQKGVSTALIATLVGVSPDSVNDWEKRFRVYGGALGK